MTQLWSFIIVSLLFTVVTSVDITFPDGDIAFKKWLDDLYEEIRIPDDVMSNVKGYVEEQIHKITDIIKRKEDCFTFVDLRGSASEGLRVLRPDEFDFTLVNDRWRGDFGLQVADNQFAYAIQETQTCLERYLVSSSNVPGAVDPRLVRGRMRTLVEEALQELGISTTVQETGPAINFNLVKEGFGEIDIDLTISLPVCVWPSNARGADDLKRVGLKIPRHGVALVPKVLIGPGQNDKVWQISFSPQETELFKKIDEDGGCRRKLLKIMKYLKTASNWPEAISSYHLKTTMMQLYFDNPDATYCNDATLVERFREFVNRFLTSLEGRDLKSFFIPTANLFEYKTPGEMQSAITAVQDMIQVIETNPNSYLPSSQNDPQHSFELRRIIRSFAMYKKMQ